MQVSKLSVTDMCEIARNGVLISSIPPECKKHWVASAFWRQGPEGNEVEKTNVPDMRLQFRYETHKAELDLIEQGATMYA